MNNLNWYKQVYTFLKDNDCYLVTEKLDDTPWHLLINSTYGYQRIRANSEFKKFGLYVSRGKSGNSMVIIKSVFADFCKANGYSIDEFLDNKAVIHYTASMFQNCRHQKNVYKRYQEANNKIRRAERRREILNSPTSTPYQKRQVQLDIWSEKKLENNEVASTKYEDQLFNKLYAIYRKRVKRQQKFIINGQVYFADIYMKAYKVVIEVDGGYHNTPEQTAKDERKDLDLSTMGLLVIRIKNEDIKTKFKLLTVILDTRHKAIIHGEQVSKGTMKL